MNKNKKLYIYIYIYIYIYEINGFKNIESQSFIFKVISHFLYQ